MSYAISFKIVFNFELEKDTLRLSWRDLNTQTAGIDAGLAGVKGE